MTDDADKLDRRLARLFEESRQEDPNEHPAPEELSAYSMNELSPGEADAIQEHLAACTFCADLLLDLESSLELPVEDRARKGVADLGAEAGWRKLREKLPRSQETAPWTRRKSPVWITGLTSAAAVLGLVFGLASYRRAVQLETAPITDLTTMTVISPAHQKGLERSGPTKPTNLKLGRVAAFETLSEYPYPKYRLIFRDPSGQIQRSVEDTEDADGKITMLLPSRFLEPGLYSVEVVGLGDGSTEIPVRDFNIRISQ